MVFDQGSLGLLAQDYKSLCAAVTICATLVNRQTLTHRDREYLTSLYETFSYTWSRNKTYMSCLDMDFNLLRSKCWRRYGYFTLKSPELGLTLVLCRGYM